MKKQAWVRIALFVALLVLGYLGYRWFIAAYGPVNWGEVLSSRDSVQSFFDRFDPYIPLAYVIVQAGQVVFAPIPGNVTSVAGGAIFGLWEGFGLSTLGLVIGSVIAFGIARFFGRPLVEAFVKPELIDKYVDTVARRHFALLLLIFLFPFFPDDALCLIAGISALPFHVFLLLVVLGRPPGMFVASLVGSGVAVVPWWGWVIIAAVSGVALYFAYRYKDMLDQKLGLAKKEETGAADDHPRPDESDAYDATSSREEPSRDSRSPRDGESS